MEESEKLVTCPSCAEEIRAEAIRCRHCGHMLIEEEWLGHARSYARMTPQRRLEWIRSLTPEQGRRFRQVWKVFGPEMERQEPQVAQEQSRKSSPLAVGCAVLMVLGLVAFVAGMIWDPSPRQEPQPALPLSERYSPPWKSDPLVVGIARALAQHQTAGCGYYQYRRHRHGQGRYLVRCGLPREGWTYYEVREASPGERGRVSRVTPDPSW